MRERCVDQAAGLLGLSPQPGPRMIVVVSHGDEQAELPLLWQLCRALVNFSYAVTVLDATISESESNPGLEQLLEAVHWRDGNNRDTPSWAVIPSAIGLKNLCAVPEQKHQNLHRLGHLFPSDAVVILYCKAEWIVNFVGDCEMTPLLAVSPMRTSLLSSYLALKRLLITGKLKPIIVNVIQDQYLGFPARAQSVSTSLSECAKKFLGYAMNAIDIAVRDGGDPVYEEVQRLALRQLECAVALNADFRPLSGMCSNAGFDQLSHFAGSH